MFPIKTVLTNTVYVAEGCNDLPACQGDGMISSTWKLTEEDMKELQRTKQITLHIWGNSQCPVCLEVSEIEEVHYEDS